MKHPLKSRLKTLAAVCFWMAAWAFLALLVGKPLLLPGPLAVFRRLIGLLGTLPFWQATGASLLRVLCGVLAASLLGVVLAALCARFAPIRRLARPVLTVIKSTPVASFTILVLLWLSRDAAPALISALIVLPVVYANVEAGILAIDPGLLELAQVSGLSDSRTWLRIRVPSVLPQFRAALRSALGFGWKAGVAAEVLTLPKHSIGRMIYESKLYLETADLFAWTLAVILLSLALEALLLRLIAGGRREHG